MALLEVVDLEKHFGGLPAVGGVSFTVDEGEIIALVGPNGAGKSTLLKAVGGMQTATRGVVRFDGTDITSFRPHQARQAGIAMVLQTPRPFETMTVRDNAILGAMFGGGRMSERDAGRAADEMLEFVELTDRRDEEVGALNLHEQRFLEIARQLAARPKLVLLDEVMAGPQRLRARRIGRDGPSCTGRVRRHGHLGRARDEGGHEPRRTDPRAELR